MAGAYWKGDAQRQQLQRLYGTALFSKQDLDDHLQQVEEAKRRDHRVLGKQLELFLIDPAVGSGLVFWLPKGAVVRRQLENFLYDELIRRGYQPVYTPVIGNVHLYETSGHYPYYKDSAVPADRNGRRRAVSAAADELPAPHHDLPARSRGATANCRCGWPSSARCTASSSRAS